MSHFNPLKHPAVSRIVAEAVAEELVGLPDIVYDSELRSLNVPPKFRGIRRSVLLDMAGYHRFRILDTNECSTWVDDTGGHVEEHFRLVWVRNPLNLRPSFPIGILHREGVFAAEDGDAEHVHLQVTGLHLTETREVPVGWCSKIEVVREDGTVVAELPRIYALHEIDGSFLMINEKGEDIEASDLFLIAAPSAEEAFERLKGDQKDALTNFMTCFLLYDDAIGEYIKTAVSYGEYISMDAAYRHGLTSFAGYYLDESRRYELDCQMAMDDIQEDLQDIQPTLSAIGRLCKGMIERGDIIAPSAFSKILGAIEVLESFCEKKRHPIDIACQFSVLQTGSVCGIEFKRYRIGITEGDTEIGWAEVFHTPIRFSRDEADKARKFPSPLEFSDDDEDIATGISMLGWIQANLDDVLSDSEDGFDGVLHISHIYVDEDFQNRGVGMQAIRQIISHFADKPRVFVDPWPIGPEGDALNADDMGLKAFDDLQRGLIRFYLRLGFKRVSRFHIFQLVP